MRSGKRRKSQNTSQSDAEIRNQVLEFEKKELQEENERLKRELELMKSQQRRVQSQSWSTEQVADAHADLLRTAFNGMIALKGIARTCQAFDHPISDSIARALDDGDFVYRLAQTVRDLVGSKNNSKDIVYNEAAPLYADMFSEVLRIGFCRARLSARGNRDIIKGLFDGFFNLEPNDYGNGLLTYFKHSIQRRQDLLREKITECLLLLHSGEKECEFSRGLYDGQIFQKLAFFACHDDITDTQRAKMIKIFLLIAPADKQKKLFNQHLYPHIFKHRATARNTELVQLIYMLANLQ